MMPTNRKPTYHSDRRLRIISAPNGEWQAQHNSQPDLPGTKGSKKEKGKPWTPNDPWTALGRPTTYANAEAQIQLKAAA